MCAAIDAKPRGSLRTGLVLLLRNRRTPGHREANLIEGARNASAVGTLIEGTSRYVVLVKLDGCDTKSAPRAAAQGHGLSHLTEADLRASEFRPNIRSRKILDFDGPDEVFSSP